MRNKEGVHPLHHLVYIACLSLYFRLLHSKGRGPKKWDKCLLWYPSWPEPTWTTVQLKRPTKTLLHQTFTNTSGTFVSHRDVSLEHWGAKQWLEEPNNHEPLLQLSSNSRRTQPSCTTHSSVLLYTNTDPHAHEVEETFELCSPAHLSTKLKMMIDPRDINDNTQQFFLLTCEGNWGEGRRKESRRRENSNPYLMFKKNQKRNVKAQIQYHNSKLIIFTNYICPFSAPCSGVASM